MPSGSDHDKRIRAEVLAACLAECRRLFDEIWEKEHGESVKLNVIERLIPRLEKLQPAAKALEALLREAKLEALSNHKKLYETDFANGGTESGNWSGWAACQIRFYKRIKSILGERITELEKARASEGEESTGS